MLYVPLRSSNSTGIAEISYYIVNDTNERLTCLVATVRGLGHSLVSCPGWWLSVKYA
jgi:hypothetical protein